MVWDDLDKLDYISREHMGNHRAGFMRKLVSLRLKLVWLVYPTHPRKYCFYHLLFKYAACLKGCQTPQIIDDSDSETDDEDSTAGDDDDRRGPTVPPAAFALNGAVGPNSSETAMAGQGLKAGDETVKHDSGRIAREHVLNDAVDAKQESNSSYGAPPGIKATDEKVRKTLGQQLAQVT